MTIRLAELRGDSECVHCEAEGDQGREEAGESPRHDTRCPRFARLPAVSLHLVSLAP